MQKGRRYLTLMQDTPKPNHVPSKIEQVHCVVDEMLEPFGKTSVRGNALAINEVPPFDLSKPNQHNSKAEFLREKELVEACLKHLGALIDLLLPNDEESERNATLDVFRPRLDAHLRKIAGRLEVESAFSLVRKNFADARASYSSLFVFIDLRNGLGERLRELMVEEEHFWSLNHRAPDYYAREIALRLARVYARETKQRPTAGTSPMDGSPSTGFTRALEQTFKILGITAQPRSPAEWAIGQLTDADFDPPRNLLADWALRTPTPPMTLITNALMAGKK